MNAAQVLVHGTLTRDGTLKLDETPQLPPGPVEVLIRTQAPANPQDETWWEYLQRGRAELLAQGIAASQSLPGENARCRPAANRQTPAWPGGFLRTGPWPTARGLRFVG